MSQAVDSQSFRVEGMTCQHCVNAVDEEVGLVAGVTAVDVDLDSGRIVVHGTGFDEQAIRAAVEEAGYTLAGPA